MKDHDNAIKREQRITWLIQNKKLWEGFPQYKLDLLGSKEFGCRAKDIIKKMKLEGLYSANTHDFDISLIALINKARKQMRSKL